MSNRNDLTTIASFKAFIKKNATDTDNDATIGDFITQASIEINQYCKRQFKAKTYVEYQSGDGISGTLFARQLPIISVTSLYDDPARLWGSANLIASTSYAVDYDAGYVELLTSVFSDAVKNLQLTYVAGYDHYLIETGVNDALDFKDDAGAEVSATLSAGTYTGDELATEIDLQLTTDGANAYTVVHSKNTGKFSITTDGTSIQILSYDGTNIATSCASTIGFLTTANPTAAATITSDFGVLGIPEDLQKACNLLTTRHYNNAGLGGSRFDTKQKDLGMASGGGTIEYIVDSMPAEVKLILDKYVKYNV